MMSKAIARVQRNLGKFLSLSLFSVKTRAWLTGIPLKYYILRKLASRLFTYSINLRYSEFLESQKALINRREWDALIVLDACRYDAFSQIVYKYLDGKLRAVLSPASVTIDWLKETWNSNTWKDVVYVSATPMVNKRGMLEHFDARAKFLDVIEVWDWGWSEELITVPPEKVNMAVRMTLTKMRLRGLKFPRDYKLVIHYVQPHAPYIALQKIIAKISRIQELREEVADVNVRRLGMFAGKFSIDHILLGVLKEFCKTNKEVNRLLRKLYLSNLTYVLRAVVKLLGKLNGNVVITADHGELLGEHGLYFHLDLPIPHLRVVPWFEVKRTQKA